MADLQTTGGAPVESRAGNSIGLLRLLLAALVIYDHCWYLSGLGDEPLAQLVFGGATQFSFLGVQGFFVISGYLILQSERRTPGTRAFLYNRGLRIYPGLWFCLIVTGLLLPLVAGALAISPHDGWAGAFRYVWRNLIDPRTEMNVPGLFPQVPRAGDLNGSLWTLPYELGCYVMLGFFGWLGLTRRQSSLPWITGAALLALYVHDVCRPDHAWFFKSAGRGLCAWFVCGALLALIPEATLRTRLRGWMAGLAVAILIASTRLGLLLQVVGPFVLAVIMLWLAWHLPLPDFERRVGGDYSYGLYIYAYPMQQLLAACGLPARGLPLYFLGALLLTIPLAVLSWHLVEKPAQRFRARAAASAS